MAFLPNLHTLIWIGLVCSSFGQSDIPDSIITRARQRDTSTIQDVVKLPSSAVEKFIREFVDLFDASSTWYQKMSQALVTTPNHLKYFADKLEHSTRLHQVDLDLFLIVGLFKSTDAARVVAPSLFDFTSTPDAGDLLSSDNAASAALALSNMKLPGTEQIFELEDWQKWAIAEGMVPAGTKVHIPDWLRRNRALAKPYAPIDREAFNKPPSSPTAPPKLPPSTPSTSTAVAAVQPEITGQSYKLWIALLASISAYVIIYLLKRRA